MAGTTGVGQAG